VTFNTESSSLTDYKTVTAGCMTDGSPTTVNVVVYDIAEEFSISPYDNFTGRSQTEFGLEEKVILQFCSIPEGITAAQAGGLWWSRQAGVGDCRDQTIEGIADYDAEHLWGGVTLRLKVLSGPSKDQYKEYDRTVIAPSGTRMTRVNNHVWHLYGFASAGIKLYYWLDPTNVSFRYLTFAENGCPATGATWYYIDNPPGDHPPNYFNGGIILGGDAVTGCRVEYYDLAFECNSTWVPGGTYIWSIPAKYKDDTGSWNIFGAHQNHNPVMLYDGTTTINKGGQSGTASVYESDSPF